MLWKKAATDSAAGRSQHNGRLLIELSRSLNNFWTFFMP